MLGLTQCVVVADPYSRVRNWDANAVCDCFCCQGLLHRFESVGFHPFIWWFCDVLLGIGFGFCMIHQICQCFTNIFHPMFHTFAILVEMLQCTECNALFYYRVIQLPDIVSSLHEPWQWQWAALLICHWLYSCLWYSDIDWSLLYELFIKNKVLRISQFSVGSGHPPIGDTLFTT